MIMTANSPGDSIESLDLKAMADASYRWKEKVWRPALRRLSVSRKLEILERMQRESRDFERIEGKIE